MGVKIFSKIFVLNPCSLNHEKLKVMGPLNIVVLTMRAWRLKTTDEEDMVMQRTDQELSVSL